MRTRAEITKKYARAYQQATKKTKGEVLDQVTAATGWSRDNARRQLTRAARPRRVKHRRKRSRKYSYDATKVKRPGFRSESQQAESEHAQEVPSRAA